MTLDPFLQAAIDKKAGEPRMASMTAAAARASRAGLRFQPWSQAAPCNVQNLSIPMPWGNCKARLYQPQNDGPLPLVVFFHGGGFVICDLETHDNLARNLSGGAGVAVLSVDYRLAPEAPYPAAELDAVESVKWAAENLNVDQEKIMVCGDSAGAYLAISVARATQTDAALPALCGQLLFYPVTDTPDAGHASYTSFAEGYGLTAKDMQWFWDHYLQGKDAKTEDVSHLQSPSLTSLPPTFLSTAEFDVLRDEGEAFAQRLAAAGVLVTSKRYIGVNHNFLAFPQSLPCAAEALGDACHWIQSQIA